MPQRVSEIPALPTRADDSNKGDFGRILIVGGSRGMAGAPCLAARAAYRGGAGLVRVVVPMSIWSVAATKLDEATTLGLPETKEGTFADLVRIWQEKGEWANVTVLGPGLNMGSSKTMNEARRCACNLHKALVLDADGLNAFPAPRLKELGAARAKQKNPAALILTPHPGEISRLLKIPVASVQKDREDAALKCQKMTHGGVVVLKGAQTVVTDGARIYINTTGNSGMATGGTGDVLAGLLGALLGQKMSAFDAAVLGVYLHGLAGDIAAARTGSWSLIAGDLIDYLPAAFLRHSAEAAQPRKSKTEILNEIKKLKAQ